MGLLLRLEEEGLRRVAVGTFVELRGYVGDVYFDDQRKPQQLAMSQFLQMSEACSNLAIVKHATYDDALSEMIMVSSFRSVLADTDPLAACTESSMRLACGHCIFAAPQMELRVGFPAHRGSTRPSSVSQHYTKF